MVKNGVSEVKRTPCSVPAVSRSPNRIQPKSSDVFFSQEKCLIFSKQLIITWKTSYQFLSKGPIWWKLCFFMASSCDIFLIQNKFKLKIAWNLAKQLDRSNIARHFYCPNSRLGVRGSQNQGWANLFLKRGSQRALELDTRAGPGAVLVIHFIRQRNSMQCGQKHF